MSSTVEDIKNPFRLERYPHARAIVDAGKSAQSSLADIVGEKILIQIICGKLSAGSRLKTTELAEELGVSRTPVAKALSTLSADGILTQRNNHRAIVNADAANWLIKIHELRELLEPEAAARSCGRMDEDVLKDLWALSRDASPTRKYDWTQAAEYFDFSLHLAIAEYCDNLPMKTAIRNCWKYKRLSYQLSDGCRSSLKEEYQDHLKILSAISEGDSATAKTLMAEHLRKASQARVAERVV